MVPSPISPAAPFTPSTAVEPPSGFEDGRDASPIAVSPPSEGQEAGSNGTTGGDAESARDQTLSAAVDAAIATQERREADKAAADEARDTQQRIQQQTAQNGYQEAREALGTPGQSASEDVYA